MSREIQVWAGWRIRSCGMSRLLTIDSACLAPSRFRTNIYHLDRGGADLIDDVTERCDVQIPTIIPRHNPDGIGNILRAFSQGRPSCLRPTLGC